MRDDVEGVGRVAAVGARVGERSDNAQELHNRARVPMADDQRQSTGLGRADVQEVDVWPSMVVVYCGYSLSFASHWRQSYPFSVSSARYTQ